MIATTSSRSRLVTNLCKFKLFLRLKFYLLILQILRKKSNTKCDKVYKFIRSNLKFKI
ncbi:hypothetical protein CAMRE0001_1712 [Campylobacter rectus RM3267]|uniref:Uncharacterized protein n=1 Tax=Campylobacter rectus RM3267 TaxID=553218 RepID=B9CZC4_CAMRE|nr:hypothetical protein CAMRE0001_1712 [Campylobacter rectus RM3267]